jgi:hypothetical protein
MGQVESNRRPLQCHCEAKNIARNHGLYPSIVIYWGHEVYMSGF